jgi:hypothetical protein
MRSIYTARRRESGSTSRTAVRSRAACSARTRREPRTAVRGRGFWAARPDRFLALESLELPARLERFGDGFPTRAHA